MTKRQVRLVVGTTLASISLAAVFLAAYFRSVDHWAGFPFVVVAAVFGIAGMLLLIDVAINWPS